MSYSFGVYVGPYFYCGERTKSSPHWSAVADRIHDALFLVLDGIEGSPICWGSNRGLPGSPHFLLDQHGSGDVRLNISGPEIERDKAIFAEQYRNEHDILTTMYERPVVVCWGVLRHVS